MHGSRRSRHGLAGAALGAGGRTLVGVAAVSDGGDGLPLAEPGADGGQLTRETARHSSASSPSVKLTNTRSRWSGVRITTPPGEPSLTDGPESGPPVKSVASQSGQQSRVARHASASRPACVS
jgi:hypothetical protein